MQGQGRNTGDTLLGKEELLTLLFTVVFKQWKNSFVLVSMCFINHVLFDLK